jgi:hypothetical protein
MGVRVVAADAPLADEVRRTMRLVGTTPDSKVKPTPYDAALTSDAAPFDSVPGLGFNSDPNAAAILPPAGRVTGTGPILVIDPAQNNAYRALNRAWEQGAKVQASADASGSPVRYAIMGSPTPRRTISSSRSRCAPSATLSAPGRAVRRPRLGLYQPWTGSMDEGWTRWLLEQYGFSYVLVHPDDFKSPLADKIDVLIIADDARVPIAGAAAGGRGRARAAAPRAVRPEYAYQLTPNDLQGFERFVRSGGTLVCLSNASAFAIQQFKLQCATWSPDCGRRSFSCEDRSSKSRPILLTRSWPA